MADAAEDANLADGRLAPWGAPEVLLEDVALDESGAGTILPDGGVARGCLRAVRYLPDDGRILAVAAGGPPGRLMGSRDGLDFEPVGRDAPALPLAAATVGPDRPGRDYDGRSYVYTLTNPAGEESPPSPPSNAVQAADGQAVALDLPAVGGPGLVRIYRSVTGSRTGAEERRDPWTIWLLAAAVEAGQGPVRLEDARPMKDLGMPLQTLEDSPPPYMRHLALVGGTGVLVGALGNRVFFSENLLPHVWPDEHVLTLPDGVANLGCLDERVLVTTGGRGFVIDGSPSCEDRKGRAVQDTDQPWPDIGRGHRSAAMTPFGLAFASVEGLALLRPDATVALLSSDWLSRDDWRALRPETARMAYWRGRLAFATDAGTFVLEIDNDTFHGYRLGALTSLSLRPTDLMVSGNGELLMLDGGRLLRFDAGPPMPFRWRSAELRFDGKTSPTVLRLGLAPGGLATVRLMALGRSWEGQAHGRHPIRLPRLGRALRCRVEIRGRDPVDFLELGTALMTLDKGE
jgi:hypothetical protein